jgi:site-specific DNA-methyltransferase (adenine-specific)
MFIFGTWKTEQPKNVRGKLIWDKGAAFGMGDLAFPFKNSFEEIYVLGDGFTGKRDEGVIRGHIQVSWESKGRMHPNQKPVSLLEYLVTKMTATTIVDPCVGVGSTLVAAKLRGRRSIGIEVEEKYCELAVKERLNRPLPLFDEAGRHDKQMAF